MKIEKKVAVITAGGSGMGGGAASRLSSDGFNVAILSSSGKGEALAKELGGVGVTGSNHSNDDVQRLVDETMEKWGHIDVLVNSAGHGPLAPGACADLTVLVHNHSAASLIDCHEVWRSGGCWKATLVVRAGKVVS